MSLNTNDHIIQALNHFKWKHFTFYKKKKRLIITITKMLLWSEKDSIFYAQFKF